MRLVYLAASGVGLAVACSAHPPPQETTARPAVAAAAAQLPAAHGAVALEDASALPADGALLAGATPADGADAGVASAYPGSTEGCPDGMVRVEGDYCPLVVATCLEKMPIGKERCVRYEEPSRCAYPTRDHLTFCIDRFEYPNAVGELPITLVDFHDAVRACATEGKRVCTVDEFNFACEGPEMRPYATGYTRDSDACNVDRAFDAVAHFRMARHDDCMNDPACAAEMQRLDRRWPIGAHTGCVSWAGVYDLNGNVNEWVRLPEKKNYPARGGLKGGWWGPVRARCRPTHTTHNEDYWGYELGFRCCKDAEGHPTDITGVSWRPSQSTDR